MYYMLLYSESSIFNVASCSPVVATMEEAIGIAVEQYTKFVSDQKNKIKDSSFGILHEVLQEGEIVNKYIEINCTFLDGEVKKGYFIVVPCTIPNNIYGLYSPLQYNPYNSNNSPFDIPKSSNGKKKTKSTESSIAKSYYEDINNIFERR